MARTTPMRLVELMVLKDDINSVVEFLAKKGNFQFQEHSRPANIEKKSQPKDGETKNPDGDIFNDLQKSRIYLLSDDFSAEDMAAATFPNDDDRALAKKLITDIEEIHARELKQAEEVKRIKDANGEAHAFANLKVPYAELDHLSFLSLRVGRIDPKLLDEIKAELEGRAVIVPLGDDKSRVLAASSKKARFALDNELKKFGFINMEIPKDFKGVPDDVLLSLAQEQEKAEAVLATIAEEKRNFATTHEAVLKALLAKFSIGGQIQTVRNSLEATSLVYRITGWIPESDSHQMMNDLDKLTEGRIAIRVYKPQEVPSVIRGEEKVPVKLKHGKLVGAFERMIFSYGSPLYGNIDPTPFVAMFFTLLFGIMFGDAGQGLVFFLAGLLMAFKVVNVSGWNKFAPIFMAIGCSSMVMGVLTGEFFATESVLEPFAMWVTGLFGDPRSPIVNFSPTGPNYIKMIFGIFGVTIGIGFIINTVGLIINIINNISHRHFGKALFGKTGLAGACFFWYVVAFAIRIVAFKHSPAVYDWVIIGILVFFAAFGEPFERLVDGETPVLENGVGSMIIGGVVEIIELVSTYLSSSISFVRVGAFALAHAVLGFIIYMMTEMVGGIGGVLILVIGNAIVIVLEGMIVAIQVVRLQYYEFFSKFFNETGREFKPFVFEYKS
ncbi:MAG: ATPase [Treponema sp.]|nr:ATPase [Treponema sp.]